MDLTIIILMATFISRGSLAPVGAKQEHKEIYVKYSILTECELNIQKKCIEVHGTARKLVVGIKVGTCDIKTMIDCFKKEKQKPECTVEDSGTVAYIDSYIKHVDTSKCMDVLGYTEVRELFKSAADFGNQIEYPYPVGTHPSGEDLKHSTRAVFHDVTNLPAALALLSWISKETGLTLLF
eukprot:gene9037-10004_t